MRISQRDNFAAQFGDVLRSSAIFYFESSEHLTTTISFMDYWRMKRNIRVAVIASLREMSGQLVLRERLTFHEGVVANYRPAVDAPFVGSVEVEVFSVDNLVIPYAAVMAVYTASRSVSMVHSYSRVYSRHEVEEGRTITQGEEGCWTLRDDEETRSFCILHNGGVPHPAQTARLEIRNRQGALCQADIGLPDLRPFETLRVCPADHLPGLSAFLGRAVGFGSISFDIAESFTRMLVGNETKDRASFKVTHSNFNYSRHRSDVLAEPGSRAWMRAPWVGDRDARVLVYPELTPGRYEVAWSNGHVEFEDGEPLVLALSGPDEVLTFSSLARTLPTRIVTGLEVQNPRGLPSETSLGVETELRPPKRLWWGLCAGGAPHRSRLFVCTYPEIFGPVPDDAEVVVRLYSSHHHDAIEKRLPSRVIRAAATGIPIDEVFSDPCDFLGEDFGYYTLASDYGGFLCYTSLSNSAGDLTIEHGF